MCSRLQPPYVQVIQRVLRSRFPASTILTIAHRLDTVIDYDHLLLMAEGRVAEARPTNMMCGVHVRVHVHVMCMCVCVCVCVCVCMCGVHTVARTVAARQAVHITCDVAAYLSRRVTQQSCSHGVPRPDSLFSALVGSGPAAERLHAIAAASARRGVSVQ